MLSKQKRIYKNGDKMQDPQNLTEELNQQNYVISNM